MENLMNTSQQIFVVFFAIFWGTSSNAWPRWKPFQWTLVPFSCRIFLRVAVSFAMLNVIPVLYFICILRKLGGSIDVDALSSFPGTCGVVLPAVVPAFAVFGFYRIWISAIEFCPAWFYYRNDAELDHAFQGRDIAPRAEARVDPTIESLNVKDWTWWVNGLAGGLYVLLASLVPLIWPPAA
jgi:hypothetical protein